MSDTLTVIRFFNIDLFFCIELLLFVYDIISSFSFFLQKCESLEDKVRGLTEQLESQYELHKVAASRARKAETETSGLINRLKSAEGELVAGDVLRDGFRTDKERVSTQESCLSSKFL